MALGEFELIRRYFRSAALEKAGPQAAIIQSIGDDAALLQPALGQQLVISTDSLVEGVHFPLDYLPADLGYRALAVAVSDLAAMAATPLAFTLALTLPAVREDWLAGFAEGLAAAAADHRISLIGGDTTRGPLNLGLTVFGQVAAGQALRRAGAAAGDLLCVGGPLGDAGAGLALVQSQAAPPALDPAGRDYLLQRFWRPRAQCGLGMALAGVASAGLDISDGLLADAGHLAAASGVAVHIRAADLPCSAALACWSEPQRLNWMLGAGDDYVLLFSLPARHRARLEADGWWLRVIGEVVAGEGVWLDQGQGPERVSALPGYQHFKESQDG